MVLASLPTISFTGSGIVTFREQTYRTFATQLRSLNAWTTSLSFPSESAIHKPEFCLAWSSTSQLTYCWAYRLIRSLDLSLWAQSCYMVLITSSHTRLTTKRCTQHRFFSSSPYLYWPGHLTFIYQTTYCLPDVTCLTSADNTQHCTSAHGTNDCFRDSYNSAPTLTSQTSTYSCWTWNCDCPAKPNVFYDCEKYFS